MNVIHTEGGISPRADTRRRFDALDSWRGILALLVALGHLSYWTGNTAVIPLSFVLAVDFFFALSGFVIAQSLFKSSNREAWVFRFAVRRFFRIYPLYIVACLIAACLTLPLRGINVFADRPPNIISWLSLLQMSGIGRVDAAVTGSAPMGIGWALSVETWLCVLFFGTLACIRSRTRLTLLLVSCCLISLQLLTTYSPNFMDVHGAKLGPIHFGILRGLAGFPAGVMAFLVFEKLPSLKVATLLETLCLIVIAVLFAHFDYRRGVEFFVPMIAGVTILIFAFQQGLWSKLLLLSLFRALGAWSFGIYIGHPLFTDLFAIAELQLTWWTASIYFLAVVGFAWVAHHLIERPAMKLGASLSGKSQQQAPNSSRVTPFQG